jgi:hypothetical protein
MKTLCALLSLGTLSIMSSQVLAGHHGGYRFNPLADCAACHGAELTGLPFGPIWAPSCYDYGATMDKCR